MWIMLTEKLPTEFSPPKMSIFWSLSWPSTDTLHDFGAKQRKRLTLMFGKRVAEKEMQKELLFDETGWGKEPNWERARRIEYRGHSIRVFPHEFNELEKDNMILYVMGDDGGDPSHELVKDNTAGESILFDIVLDKDMKPLFEAAMIEGANEQQATLMAIGMDITFPDADFPPIGWYRIVPEYGMAFCAPEELEEKY